MRDGKHTIRLDRARRDTGSPADAPVAEAVPGPLDAVIREHLRMARNRATWAATIVLPEPRFDVRVSPRRRRGPEVAVRAWRNPTTRLEGSNDG